MERDVLQLLSLANLYLIVMFAEDESHQLHDIVFQLLITHLNAASIYENFSNLVLFFIMRYRNERDISYYLFLLNTSFATEIAFKTLGNPT